MSNISQLEDYINQRRTYQEVSNKAFEINPNWRSETWTRGLREKKNILPLKNDKGHIIAYVPSESLKTPLEAQISKKIAPDNLRQEPLIPLRRITY